MAAYSTQASILWLDFVLVVAREVARSGRLSALTIDRGIALLEAGLFIGGVVSRYPDAREAVARLTSTLTTHQTP